LKFKCDVFGIRERERSRGLKEANPNLERLLAEQESLESNAYYDNVALGVYRDLEQKIALDGELKQEKLDSSSSRSSTSSSSNYLPLSIPSLPQIIGVRFSGDIIQEEVDKTESERIISSLIANNEDTHTHSKSAERRRLSTVTFPMTYILVIPPGSAVNTGTGQQATEANLQPALIAALTSPAAASLFQQGFTQGIIM